ncbi:chemotaxis protein CheY [Candidatus Magnetomorum sp. HK-1]|nr:chemotaxis protein CheY [Candidatus Magnetomorum sp. HK-1]
MYKHVQEDCFQNNLGHHQNPNSMYKSMFKNKNVFVYFIIITIPIFEIFYTTSICAEESPSLLNKMEFERAFDIGGEPSFAMIMDKDGFLWVGSFFSGLVKFDGSSIKNYKAGVDSISSNFVTQIFEDSDGIIWIGTNEGLNCYDKQTNKFTVYKNDPTDSASLVNNVFNLSSQTIIEDSSGLLWFGTQGGLSCLDKKTKKFQHFVHDPENEHSISGNDIYSIIEDQDGYLWIGTKETGLNKFDPKSKLFIRYQHNPKDLNTISSNDVYSLKEDLYGFIWVGTKNMGLNKLDKNNNKIIRYQHNPEKKNSFPKKQFWHFCITRSGYLIAESHNEAVGLFVMNINNDEYALYQHDVNISHSISNNSIHGIYEDPHGIIWVIYNSGQVDKYDPKSRKFKLYTLTPNDPNSLLSNTPIPIFEDKQGMIWIGHFGAGLDRYDPKTDEFTHYLHAPDNPATIPHGYPCGFFEDDAGNFIVSTGNGLCLFDRKQGSCIKQLTTNTYFYTIRQDPHDEHFLWMTGWKQNLCKYNKKSNEISCYNHDPQDPKSLSNDTALNFIIDKDDENVFWLATWGGGLEKFNKKRGLFTHYKNIPDNNQSISSNTVYDVLEDSNGKFWVCTENGLNLFDKKKGTFKRYSKENKFFAKIIHNVLEDNDDNLWLGTDIGLVKFNVNSETVEKVFTKSDGLHSNGFFCTSRKKTRNGQLWFGGFNGLNSFYPDKIQNNSFRPPVYITSIKQGGNEISLNTSFERATQIILPWQHNYFEFEYVALNYTKSEKNQYLYFLEGYDKMWFHAGTKRFGRYSGLPGGEYILRIKGSNNDGLWSDHEVKLNVIVRTSFWKTKIAYLFYLSIICIGIFLVIWSHRKKLDRQRLINDRLRNLDRVKDEFLANTSHELRTPINGIIGIAEHLIEAPDSKLNRNQKRDISLIVHSARQLANLVNDILDFSRLKHKDLQLQIKPVDLNSVLDVVIGLTSSLIGQKSIKIHNKINLLTPSILADENRLHQILYNLLGNAIKFTISGSITISAKVESNSLIISVKDTGIGIKKEKFDSIFDSFEQADGSTARRFGGAGLGLSITRQLVELHGGKIWLTSKINYGTIFYFTMPISEEKADNKAFDQKPIRFLELLNDKEEINQVENQTNNDKREYTILIVDDEPINRHVLKNQLLMDNYSIIQAENGQQALAKIQKNKIDLVLLDIMMPGMTGYEVCQHIRKKYKPNELPVLMLTAKNQLKDLVIGFKVGANDYLPKPFAREELMARIKTQLNLKKLINENTLLNTELDIARRIQQMVLPGIKEINQIASLDIAGFMEPANETGGDYYDILPHNESIKIGIGDVTGHGLESSFIMLMVQTAIRTLTIHGETDQKRFLKTLNSLIYNNEKRMQIDKCLSLALINYYNNTFTITGQHEEIIIVRKNGTIEILDTLDLGFPIGLDKTIEQFIDSKTIHLEFGDGIVLFTDGFTESENIKGEFYGLQRLCKIISDKWHKSANQILKAVFEDVHTFIGEQVIYDDLTLVVIKQI